MSGTKIAFSSEVDTGSREENASQEKPKAARRFNEMVKGFGMRQAGWALVVTAAIALAPASAAAALTCAEFQEAFVHNVPELSPQFGRSVVISRGTRGDARELTTSSPVEGRLTCEGNRFIRFEAQLQMPSNPAGRDAFFRVQLAAAMAGLKWSRNRATQNIIGMSSEAADYLRASEERGDVSVAGKVERHAGTAGDLAAMWTKTDRTFIVLASD